MDIQCPSNVDLMTLGDLRIEPDERIAGLIQMDGATNKGHVLTKANLRVESCLASCQLRAQKTQLLSRQ